MAPPPAADARQARDRLYAIGAKRKLAATSAASPAAATTPAPEGAIFVSRVRGIMGGAAWDEVFELEGDRLSYRLKLIALGALPEVSGFSVPGDYARGSAVARDGVFEFRDAAGRLACRLRSDGQALLCGKESPGFPTTQSTILREAARRE